MDAAYRSHTTWALAGDDGLFEVVRGDMNAAYAAAARYGRPVLDAYGERDKMYEEPPMAMAANPRRLPTYASSPKASLERTGLPRVDLRSVLRKYPLGAGGNPAVESDGLRRAHAELVRHFPQRALRKGVWESITIWQTPRGGRGRGGMVDALLSGNMKMDKPRLLEDGRVAVVRGLSLLPNVLPFKRGGLGDGTLCLWATPQCMSMCLVHTGQNKSDPYNEGVKLAKTLALLTEPEAFCRMLLASVHAYTCSVRCDASEPFVRANVYSDIPWELVFPGLFDFFPEQIFYDYTKVPGRKTPPTYDLTFSISGTKDNIAHAKKEVDHGRRIAVVFLLGDGDNYPKTFALGDDERYRMKVLDGTADDVRPLDPAPSVIGLKWRQPFGRTRKELLRTKGFNVFVVPAVVDQDGNVLATETPRFTAAGDSEEE